jgi:hypothetical protein
MCGEQREEEEAASIAAHAVPPNSAGPHCRHLRSLPHTPRVAALEPVNGYSSVDATVSTLSAEPAGATAAAAATAAVLMAASAPPARLSLSGSMPAHDVALQQHGNAESPTGAGALHHHHQHHHYGGSAARRSSHVPPLVRSESHE